MSTLKTSLIQHPSAVDPAIELDAAGKLWLAGGKVLQVVRATDSTDRSTSSSSYVDANISVTITPQKSTSAIILIWATNVSVYVSSGTRAESRYVITDSSNNIIGGLTRLAVQASSSTNIIDSFMTLIRYDTPATTSAITYKGRFLLNNGTAADLLNGTFGAAQLYAIEVSA